jgi:hypothetical protein
VDVLHRHLLLVAKTRRGKYTLMQRLATFAMQVTPRRSVLIVDPHRDLATAVLSVVPAEGANRSCLLTSPSAGDP